MELEEDKVYLGWMVERIELPRGNTPRLQVHDWETGKNYEGSLAISIDKKTNEIELQFVRHYTDPESQAWWPDSDVWPEELLEEHGEISNDVKLDNV